MEETSVFTDRPIEALASDELNRTPFVSALGAVVLAWNGKTSLVIGLHGAWGEGKTSVVNFLAPTLSDAGMRVLRFSPWEWSSMRDLHDAFFDEVASSLGELSRKDNEELAKAWRRYAARLKGLGAAASLLVPIVKAAILVCAIFSCIGVIMPERALFVVSLVLLIIALASIWFGKLLPAMAELISPKDKELLPSLEKLKSDLSKCLLTSALRIVVVFDDLDRLAPEQIADLMRLVKANGDLPGLCYLLVGDRQIMIDHLTKSLGVNGAAYLEKIVQLSFDLPAIPQIKLNDIFIHGLNDILSSQPQKGVFDTDRWPRIFWTGVAPSIITLRSVKRLLATLRVNIALLTGEAAFEVNQVDFVALESIRVFEPVLYRTLRRSKSKLTDTSQERDRDTAGQHAQQTLDEMTEGVDILRRRSWQSLLGLLFPLLDAGSRGFRVDQDTTRLWSRKQRICSPIYFDRYFRFGPSVNEVSSSALQELMEVQTRADYAKHLLVFAKEDKLRDRVDDVPQEAILPLIIALSDTGDELPLISNEMFGISSSQEAEFCIEKLVERVSDDNAKSVLDELFRESTGLRLPLEVFRNLLGRQKEGRLSSFLTNEDLEAWKKLFAIRIARYAATGGLMKLQGAGPYLYLWSIWGNENEVRTFVSDLLKTRDGALTFLKALVLISHTETNGVAKQESYIRHSDISRFADPEVVYSAIGVSDAWDEKMLRILHPEFKDFESALKRFRKGTADDGYIWEQGED